MLNRIREFILGLAISATESLRGLALGLIAIIIAAGLYAFVTNKKETPKPQDSIVMVLVKTDSEQSGGSGFIAENKKHSKYVVTAEHVCDPLSTVGDTVIIRYKDTLTTGTVRYSSVKQDICLIEAPSLKGVPALRVVEPLSVFQPIYLFGYPGLNSLARMAGMIYSLDEPLDILEDSDPETGACPPDTIAIMQFPYVVVQCTRVYENGIKSNALLGPGASGGPFVNALGEVVGMLTIINPSYGFGPKATTIRRALDSLP